MPKEDVRAFEVGILVRNNLAEEPIQISESQHFPAPKLSFRLVFSLQRRKARDRRIESGIHRLVIRGALPLLRLEINAAESLHLFSQVNSRSIEFAFELIHARRIDLFAHLRAFIVGLERFADFLAIVYEVEHKSVFLERMDAVQAR